MKFSRACGTIVHPTSFPSNYGVGDFGDGAVNFIDFLKESGQSIWQILPLTPVGYGNSPYASYSAFAGNYYLISLDLLVKKGLLTASEVAVAQLPSTQQALYDDAYRNKDNLFRIAAKNFFNASSSVQRAEFEEFKKSNKFWLEDYTLFMTCLKANGNKSWNLWAPDIARRDHAALKTAKQEHADEILFQTWLQFEFAEQWNQLKSYANQQNIRVVGDIPIFVDHNSADVWSHPSQFEVDKSGKRTLVAGVPPDYFSKTGQLWGNPLYKWRTMERDGFKWWVERFRQMFHLYDAIRVDHFRGFEAYWEVRASEKNAVNGRWVKAPGKKFFNTLQKKLGKLPVIAEDLGVITPEVDELRDAFNFPGMKVLQFAFGSDAANQYLPHNYPKNSVVYSGTHDNDTTLGWYRTAPLKDAHRARVYTRSDGTEINWEFIRLGMLSSADQAIFPLQDFMNLGSGHRMNTPGTTQNNWNWRYTTEMLEDIDKDRIRFLAELSNRIP